MGFEIHTDDEDIRYRNRLREIGRSEETFDPYREYEFGDVKASDIPQLARCWSVKHRRQYIGPASEKYKRRKWTKRCPLNPKLSAGISGLKHPKIAKRWAGEEKMTNRSYGNMLNTKKTSKKPMKANTWAKMLKKG